MNRLVAILCLPLLMVAAPAAAELRVLAPNATKPIVAEAIARYETATGDRVTVAWAGTEAITRRIGEGEAADVVVNAAQNIDRQIRDGILVDGTRTDFSRSAIGVAVRHGQPHFDPSSVEAIRQALLMAKTIAISSGTSGRHLEAVFQRLGIADAVNGRLRQPPSGAQIGEMLARGEAEIGFQQVGELMHVQGIDFLGPLPGDLQSVTVYSSAIHAKAGSPQAARKFLEVLAAPDLAEVIRRSGMEPVTR
jgi:molybdate transport system substrate-binding protein